MEIRKEKGVLKFIKTTGDIATVSMIDGTMREFKSDKEKWVNDYSLVKRLEEIVDRFNLKYGEDNKIDKIVKMLQDGDYDKNVLELLKKLY